MVHKLAQQLRTSIAGNSSSSGLVAGALTVQPGLYTIRRFGYIKGTTVRVEILGESNMAGASPVTKVRESDTGEADWLQTSQVIDLGTDPFAPIPAAARAASTPNAPRARTRSRKPAAAKPAA